MNGGSNLVSIMLWTVLPTIYFIWEFHAVGSQMMADPAVALQAMQQNSGLFDSVDIALTFPGPAYSIWRRIRKKNACPGCGEKIMVPAAGDLAKKFASMGANLDADISPEELKKIPFRWEKDVKEYKEKYNIPDAPKTNKIVENKIEPARPADENGSKNEW